MRRLLAIFLLLLLPLQFSWAAVAVYCGHEAGPDQAHFGHHVHEHHAADVPNGAGADLDAADAAKDTAPGAPHLDCGQCHGTPGAVLTSPAALPGLPTAPGPAAAPDAAATPGLPAQPERPQWARLA